MFELRVLSGLHQGAALPLIGDQWLIGSDVDQQLVLNDSGVAGVHCRLQRIEDTWKLTAVDGVVCNEQGQAQAVTELTPDHNFTLGPVWLCLAAAEKNWPATPVLDAIADDVSLQPTCDSLQPAKVSLRSRLFNRANGVIMGLLIGVVGSAWSLSRTPSPAPVQVAAVEAPVAISASKRIPLETIEDTQRQLNMMLSDRVLNDVSAQQVPDGLTLNGSLNEESLVVYQRMLQLFKDRYESPIKLIDNVTTSSTGLPFVIVQIISGPQAHLVTADGQRLYIGDELHGVRFTRIDDQHIEFEGERHYEMRW